MKIALVTGCRTGIGRAVALRLARLGYHTYAGVRTDRDRQVLLGEHTRLRPIILDVIHSSHILHTKQALEEYGRLDVLVNNAGVARVMPLETAPTAAIQHHFAVNTIGALNITQMALPFLRDARGQIINVSSMAGPVPYPFMGPYSASKAALEALSSSLRQELRPWGIQVSIIRPGAVRTPILAKGPAVVAAQLRHPDVEELYGDALRAVERFFSKVGGVPATRVADVVERVVRARRPRFEYRVGPDAWVLLKLARLLPGRILDELIRRQLRIP